MEEQRQVYMKYEKEEEVKERPGGGRVRLYMSINLAHV